MKRWIGPLLVLAVAGVAGHWATLAYAPSVIMNGALAAMEDRGIAEHAFTTPQRITPQTQAVVRSSPDLYYSLCRYDLSAPGSVLTVTMGAWPDYQSLSFFDASTNNFATFRVIGEAKTIKLFPKDALAERVTDGRLPPNDETWQSTPSGRGIVLIRRLAPTAERFAKAQEASMGDACELSVS